MFNIHLNLVHAKQLLIDLFHKLGLQAHHVYDALLQNFKLLETFATDLLAVLENPIVDAVIATVFGNTIADKIPAFEVKLMKAISDLSIAMKIKADIDAAPDNEAKLKIFLVDLQKYDAIGKGIFINKLISLLLAGIDDNKLKQNLYDLFTQAHYSESKLPA